MKDIKKINNNTTTCSQCDQPAVTKIKQEPVPFYLCEEHEEKFADKLRERVKNRYEGMTQEEIKEDMLDNLGEVFEQE